MGHLLWDQLNTIHPFSTANTHKPFSCSVAPNFLCKAPPSRLPNTRTTRMQSSGRCGSYRSPLSSSGWWSVKRIIKTQFVTATHTHTHTHTHAVPGEDYSSPAACFLTVRTDDGEVCCLSVWPLTSEMCEPELDHKSIHSQKHNNSWFSGDEQHSGCGPTLRQWTPGQRRVPKPLLHTGFGCSCLRVSLCNCLASLEII